MAPVSLLERSLSYTQDGSLPAVLAAALTLAVWICGLAAVNLLVRGILDRANRADR